MLTQIIYTKSSTCATYKTTSDEVTETGVSFALKAVERKQRNVNAAKTDNV